MPELLELLPRQWLREHVCNLRKTLLVLRAWLTIRGLLQPKVNTRVGLNQKLGVFLWMVGRNVHVRDAQSRLQHSKPTIHNVFHDVLDALLYLYADYVRPLPDDTTARVQKY